MKVAILAGGRGTRIAAGEGKAPKPLAPVGDFPLLWHIMQIYRHFGHGDFIVALGHSGDEIVDHFLNEPCWSGAALALPGGSARDPMQAGPRWHIRLVDTGPDTQSAGRIGRLRPFLDGEAFMLTWCDGLADIDLAALAAFHFGHGKLATLTAVHPPPRFGRLRLDGERVSAFEEKAVLESEWINGAFFAVQPALFDSVALDDDMPFEGAPLESLAARGELMAYRHRSFWHCADTESERATLDRLWRTGKAPWKTWAENAACA